MLAWLALCWSATAQRVVRVGGNPPAPQTARTQTTPHNTPHDAWHAHAAANSALLNTTGCASAAHLSKAAERWPAHEATASITYLIAAVAAEARADADASPDDPPSGACRARAELALATALLADGQRSNAARAARRAAARGSFRDAALAQLAAALDAASGGSDFAVRAPALVQRNETLRPSINRDVAVTGNDVAVRFCTFLDESELVSCAPQATLSRLKPGWHVLHAVATGLPSGVTIANASTIFCVESCPPATKPQLPKSTIPRPRGSKGRLVVLTLVLNGMPFLAHHHKTLTKLDIEWEWHLVEGLATGRADASSPYSSQDLSDFHRDGLSTDGTSEYIDALARIDGRIHVHRSLWRDKVEMINKALEEASTGPDAIILQIDVDELWTADQLLNIRDSLLKERCAYFHCHFLVGPHLATATSNGYGHSDGYEWLRAWRADPSRSFWASHAPPLLVERVNGTWLQLTGDACMTHATTASKGLVFTHHAYVSERQVAFKAKFYGYDNAVEGWRSLQNATPPADLGDYLDWVRSEPRFASTVVDATPFAAAAILGVGGPAHTALTAPHASTAAAEVLRAVSASPPPVIQKKPLVAVDGVAFQRVPTGGIARVWTELLPRLHVALESVDWRLTVLERAGSAAPHIGEVRNLAPFPEDHDHAGDAEHISLVASDASVFISTEYTRPSETWKGRVVLLVHDLTPEIFGWPLDNYWTLKREAVIKADQIVAVSQATADASQQHYGRSSVIARNGVDLSVFYPRQQKEIDDLKGRTHVELPYILLVGPRLGYKNGDVVQRAFYQARARQLHLFMVGGGPPTDREREILGGPHFNVSWSWARFLNDDDLAAAYSGAVALAYASRDEGFGLPMLEALACGCPVVAAAIPASQELLGDLVLPHCGSDKPCAAVLIDPDRATAAWHAFRALFALSADAPRLAAARRRLVARAQAFSNNWDLAAGVLKGALVV
ncbi:unnamed protein product [Pelagomonas calceolata]|uniref:Glycosyl transferase family 1 domain-containing protein n=2 Tax=Pelagomonas calceolata TaxID=35677 RepID=A0A8J2WHZ4_9STRA|nr:unnamed protein product [Pelagomonas calceolata]